MGMYKFERMSIGDHGTPEFIWYCDWCERTIIDDEVYEEEDNCAETPEEVEGCDSPQCRFCNPVWEIEKRKV